MLALQGVAFLLLPHASSVALFFALSALIYVCYDGGFGTMPATAADYFGTKNAGAIYGAVIVAWSTAGVIGPKVAAALYEGSGNAYAVPFSVIGLLALAAIVLPVVTRLPAPRPRVDVTPLALVPSQARPAMEPEHPAGRALDATRREDAATRAPVSTR